MLAHLTQDSATSTPSADHSKVFRTELTPVSFLRRSAAVFPDKTAIVHAHRGTSYSYRQFAARVDRLPPPCAPPDCAKMTESRFSAPTSRPCWRRTSLSPPRAAFWLPSTPGSMDPRSLRFSATQGRGSFSWMLSCSLSWRRLIWSGSPLSALTTPGSPVIPTRTSSPPARSASQRAGWNEEEMIAINYTSGTTGRPKGVEYTHRGAYLMALSHIIETD